MAKNSIEAYGAQGKTNVLMFDPDALTLVTDAQSLLYDARVHLPLDPAMVANIKVNGVFTPVVITKSAETGATEVVAGRQRVKNAREANRQLVAEGLPPVQIPAVVRKDKAAGLMGVMVSENEIRQPDTPLGRAEKMARMVSRAGYDERYVAVAFGCTVRTVRDSLALLDQPAVVQEALQAGDINFSHAKKLSGMAPEAQRAKVAKIAAAGAGVKGHEKARRQQQAVDGDQPPKMRTRAEVQRLHDAQEEGSPARGALAWVLRLDGSK